MSTNLLRMDNGAEFGRRRGIAVLLLILLAVGLCSALHAVAKPFWYDEICTVILCRLPSAPEIWKALDHAADTKASRHNKLTILSVLDLMGYAQSACGRAD
jgi:hypothetical protein